MFLNVCSPYPRQAATARARNSSPCRRRLRTTATFPCIVSTNFLGKHYRLTASRWGGWTLTKLLFNFHELVLSILVITAAFIVHTVPTENSEPCSAKSRLYSVQS